jgi:hypothetical protein
MLEGGSAETGLYNSTLLADLQAIGFDGLRAVLVGDRDLDTEFALGNANFPYP